MTEKAIARLASVEAVLRQGQGGIARDTDYARRVASDIRALLSLARQGLEMEEALRKIEARTTPHPDDTLSDTAKDALKANAIARAALQSRSL